MAEEEDKSADYLYHKQRAEEGAEPEEVSKVIPKKARVQQSPNVGNRYFLNNLRTFGLVFIVMVILLLVAFFLSGRRWENKESKYQKQIQELQLRNERQAENKTKYAQEMRPDDEFLNDDALSADQKASPKRELDVSAITKANALAKRGDLMYQKNDLQGAIKNYKEALELWPYLGDVWASLGEVFIETKEFDNAQIALKRAAHSKPNDAKVLSDLGLTYLHQREINIAKEVFEAAQLIDPNYKKTHFYLGLCFITVKDYEQANEEIQEYLKHNPNDAVALKEMAYISTKQNLFGKALQYIKRALAETPDNGALYYDAAGISAFMGRIQDSIRYLEKGEAFSSPHKAYQVYMKPAFKEVRLSTLGKLYEQELAERARRMIKTRQTEPSPSRDN